MSIRPFSPALLSPAVARNRDPILAVLQELELPEPGRLRGPGSGRGLEPFGRPDEHRDDDVGAQDPEDAGPVDDLLGFIHTLSLRYETGEARQDSLMPQNIFYRRPEFFRHGNKPRLAFSKCKQRQIVFQNKQSELMAIEFRQHHDFINQESIST
jgi:hypothetical protein